MEWSNIKRFCFTYALMGGAWLEDASGTRNWYTKTYIDQRMGAGWFLRHYQRQGMFTGLWINVED